MPASIQAVLAGYAFFDSLDNSQFVGCTDLEFISIHGQFFSHPLPTVWATLPSLVDLMVSDCGIEGTLDDLIGIRPERMWIDTNPNLTGTIPTEFGGMDNAQAYSYSFTENTLFGTIPTEFGELVNLEGFWVYRNFLNGAVPSEMALLTKLKTFRTEENNFSGSMPSEICSNYYTVLGSKCMHLGNNICTCCKCCSVEECNPYDPVFNY